MTKAFSAPGKALLAGGYLVLDPQYDAYVVALSSRMYAVIDSNGENLHLTNSKVIITSPQFQNGEWEYHFEKSADYKHPMETKKNGNPFLEATLATILSYTQPNSHFDLKITIFSDPGYHSQTNTSEKHSVNGKKTFLYHSQEINKVPKTGLGSSAGLVTVVTTALMSYFQPGSEDSLDLIHNLAQVAHCKAQNKIGSGFDVAAAVYGSIIYRRFQPLVVTDILDKLYADPHAAKLAIDGDWEFKHAKCALPPSIRLMMGDIQGGSETPKMVSKVLQWRSECPERAKKVYKLLNDANVGFTNVIGSLSQDSMNITKDQRRAISEAIQRIRQGLKELTAGADVPVEPPIQTTLLDNVSQINGCLGGVVPGAGGYDAVAVLVLAEYMDTIKESTKTSPELYNFVQWVDLHEEAEGLRKEDISDFNGLI
ncbi:hypothetical protein LELG_04217 [Lodderomyces elongisporus NRRL YB-4239]|uniref:Phosphomevalonate kinase n=1 Tax=Lodderomyces elongisporus (strain ATCC 11503 / CBS 2605 / JCM 1781 / NBRC 1676 / NRRL YB-4239) TaxID=379508 RepID=A5E3M9_LODEL|nr:hypothetical protein LELG_04217 [Lodderomyces elongisporus NRRL YB-4239]